ASVLLTGAASMPSNSGLPREKAYDKPYRRLAKNDDKHYAEATTWAKCTSKQRISGKSARGKHRRSRADGVSSTLAPSSEDHDKERHGLSLLQRWTNRACGDG